MKKHIKQKAAKKALELVKSLQTQLSTAHREATIEDVVSALVKQEEMLAKKREKVQKRQEKVNELVTVLKRNQKEKKAFVNGVRQNMVPVYEKHYDIEGRPVITICRVQRRDKVYEGWAICSDVENPRHKKGESIALRRAAQVLATGKNSLPIERDDARDIVDTLNVFPDDGYKSRCYDIFYE